MSEELIQRNLVAARRAGLKMLFTLVDDGLIPLDAALGKANMSEEEFNAHRLKMMGSEE